ncbi:hypothetical protein [Lysobacter sp. F6437]|uniref:hypothetical protein n=1 Tax=Lysobacter sp. F6437 TaxID=3459296 RepID=UPI00403D9920
MPLSRYLILVVALAASILAIYWPGLSGGFIFDDFPNLVTDSHWRVTSMDLDQWRRAISHGRSGFLGRPLALATFAANHYFTGTDPFWLKLTNLGLHLVNTALIYCLCRQLLLQIAYARGEQHHSRFAAMLIALAWAVHPLQASTVLYAIQRMEIAAATCVLLSLLAYLRGRRNQISGTLAWPWLLTSAFVAVAGLGFKESALLAPGFALLIEICVLHFAGQDGARSTKWVTGYVVAGGLALAMFAGVILPHYLAAEAYATRDFSLSERLLTQLPVLVMYLKQIAWPVPNNLLFYYDHLPISTGLFSPPATAIGAALLLTLLTTAGMTWRRWPLVSLGIGWFFLSHALTSNVVPLELAFEHRNYLALLGVLLAAMTPLTWLGTQLNRAASRIITVLPVLLLGVLCVIQTHTWGNPDRLTVALATRNIESPRATYALAKLLLRNAGSDTQSAQWSMAHREFEHVAKLRGSGAMGEHALIIMDGRRGQPISTELWDAFRAKLTARKRPGPDVASAIYPVVICRIEQRCQFDDKQMIHTFAALIEKYPSAAELYAIYANYSFNALGDISLSIELLREAHRLEPSSTKIAVSFAKVLRTSPVPSNQATADQMAAQLRAANYDGHLDAALDELEALNSTSPPIHLFH